MSYVHIIYQWETPDHSKKKRERDIMIATKNDKNTLGMIIRKSETSYNS